MVTAMNEWLHVSAPRRRFILLFCFGSETVVDSFPRAKKTRKRKCWTGTSWVLAKWLKIACILWVLAVNRETTQHIIILAWIMTGLSMVVNFTTHLTSVRQIWQEYTGSVALWTLNFMWSRPRRRLSFTQQLTRDFLRRKSEHALSSCVARSRCVNSKWPPKKFMAY